MNYRHIYHAGNFADVMKHMTLALVLDYMKKKETPFFFLDAHGGLGFYNLQSEQAEKTLEWKDGIGTFEGTNHPEDFDIYFDLIRDDLKQGFYAGSPVLAARMLRAQDRYIANELHPEDYDTLKQNMRGFGNGNITHQDAYECIRANIPPAEKRGVILIDPPFEKKDEFEILVRQMKDWKKRFERGVFIIWYPIKAHLGVDALKQAARDLGVHRTWCVETYMHPKNQIGTFNGSGLIILNAPFTIPEQVTALLPYLEQHMKLSGCACEWLTDPA